MADHSPLTLAPHDTVITPDGIALGAWCRGEGPAVLLIGGLGMPSMVWEICGLAPALVDAGFRVIRYNARGLAPSMAPPAPYSMDDMMVDAVAVLDHYGVDHAIVVGYSMGCYTTQMLLRSHPGRVSAAVLFAGLQPTPVGEIVGEMELGLIDKYGEVPREVLVFEQLMTTLHPSLLQEPAAVGGWRDVLAHGDGGWADPEGFRGQLTASQQWITSREPKPEHLAQIQVPTLVLAFEFDLFFPPGQCAATASLIPGAKFVQIDGAGHGGLFTGPGDSAKRITKFCTAHRDDADGHHAG
ncbi:alpha/beta fold hydrolase [Tomitella gaofuii]|uniref:alpha/beta fold hydrolase n=1 Tax=Tomitella gaofuii TaxID=2760083 RepID=UPI0015F87420|nr:alpha/beta hydrolase [Tomitella gaofuii]